MQSYVNWLYPLVMDQFYLHFCKGTTSTKGPLPMCLLFRSSTVIIIILYGQTDILCDIVCSYMSMSMSLSSVVEKKACCAISVLSISWVETLLTYQGSLLVTNTLREGDRRGSREGKPKRLMGDKEAERTEKKRRGSN